MQDALKPETFRRLYTDFAAQNPMWNEISSSTGAVYQWDPASTYIQEPPFFEDFSLTPEPLAEIRGARAWGQIRVRSTHRTHQRSLLDSQHRVRNPNQPALCPHYPY